MAITHGTIKYGQTVKTGDYENKRCDAEISFSVPEGEDPETHIENAKNAAHWHANDILNKNTSTPPAVKAKESTVAKKEPKKLPKAAEPEQDPLADRTVPPFIAKEIAEANAKSAETVEEDLGDLMGGEEPVKEITDKELTDATQKCQSRAKNAPAIRKALNELGIKTPPGRIIDLPQEKRAEYLKKLEEIKPLA